LSRCASGATQFTTAINTSKQKVKEISSPTPASHLSSPSSHSTPYSAASPSKKPGGALPRPWTEQRDDKGNTYFYNTATGASQWERPLR